MITPTVGRKVWFRPNGGTPVTKVPLFAYNDEQPMDATIVYVHSDRMVNLCVIDHMGYSHAVPSVTLRQGDDEKFTGMYCEWMPFQKGQAAPHRCPNCVTVGNPPPGLCDGQTWEPGRIGPSIPNLLDFQIGSPPLRVLPVTACSADISAQILGGTGQLS